MIITGRKRTQRAKIVIAENNIFTRSATPGSIVCQLEGTMGKSN
jgi:hypothetical protein